MNLLPNTIEESYLAKTIEEAHRLFGFEARYFGFVSESVYQDQTVGEDTGIDIKILFESNPSKKLLRSLGWFSEDADVLPYVVYLPLTWGEFELKPKRGDWFRFKDIQIKVTEVNRLLLYGLWFVCKCVSFENDPVVAEPPENSGKFLGDVYED